MPTEGTPVGRVAGKVVVITGAARGQGAAEARALAAEGAVVVATDVLAAEEVAPGELDPRNAALLYRQLDVTDPAAWARLAAELRTRFGQVHGLVNNAGCTHLARLLDVELADWERVLRVNTTGPLLGIQALVPLMPPGASLVTIGSVAALTPNFTAAYTASKWAVRGLAKVASLELGPLGIRSNLVHPGYIETPMVAGAPPAFRRAQLAANPLGVARGAGGRGAPGGVPDQRRIPVPLRRGDRGGRRLHRPGRGQAALRCRARDGPRRRRDLHGARAQRQGRSMSVVAVTYRYTDDVATRDRVLPEHRRYLRGLADAGPPPGRRTALAGRTARRAAALPRGQGAGESPDRERPLHRPPA